MPRKKPHISQATDAVESDDIVAEEESDSPQDALRRLRKKLQVCEDERQEYLLGWQRARADAVNRERETEALRVHATERIREDMLTNFLPVLDSFDMAFSNKDAWHAVEKNWRIGVENIHIQLLKILESEGVVRIDVPGEKFNPEIHEPIDTRAVSDPAQEDTVLEIVQKGYQSEKRVIRPAKVIIGKLNQ